MQQVLADAAALQPAARRPMSRWAQWMSMLGGAPGMGGLVAASCLGVWIGVGAPEGLPDLGGALVGTLATDTDEVAVAALFEDGWVSGVEEGLDDE